MENQTTETETTSPSIVDSLETSAEEISLGSDDMKTDVNDHREDEIRRTTNVEDDSEEIQSAALSAVEKEMDRINSQSGESEETEETGTVETEVVPAPQTQDEMTNEEVIMKKIQEENDMKNNLEKIALSKVEAIMNTIDGSKVDEVDLSQHVEKISLSDDEVEETTIIDNNNDNVMSIDKLMEHQINPIDLSAIIPPEANENDSVDDMDVKQLVGENVDPKDRQILFFNDHSKNVSNKNTETDVNDDIPKKEVTIVKPVEKVKKKRQRRRKKHGRSKSAGKFLHIKPRYLEPAKERKRTQMIKKKSLVDRKSKKILKLSDRERTPLYKREVVVNKNRREMIEFEKKKKMGKFVKPHRERRSKSAFHKRKKSYKLLSNTPSKRIHKFRVSTSPTRREIVEEKMRKKEAKIIRTSRDAPSMKRTKKQYAHVKSKTIAFRRSKENYAPNQDSRRFDLDHERDLQQRQKSRKMERYTRALKLMEKKLMKTEKRIKSKARSKFRIIPKKYAPRRPNTVHVVRDMKKREGLYVKKSRRFNWDDPEFKLSATEKYSKVQSKVMTYEEGRMIDKQKKQNRLNFNKTMSHIPVKRGKSKKKSILSKTLDRSFLMRRVQSARGERKRKFDVDKKERLRSVRKRAEEFRRKQREKRERMENNAQNNFVEEETVKVNRKLDYSKVANKKEEKEIESEISQWTDEIPEFLEMNFKNKLT